MAVKLEKYDSAEPPAPIVTKTDYHWDLVMKEMVICQLVIVFFIFNVIEFVLGLACERFSKRASETFDKCQEGIKSY